MLRMGIPALEASGRWRVAHRCTPPCTKCEQVSTMSTCMYACAIYADARAPARYRRIAPVPRRQSCCLLPKKPLHLQLFFKFLIRLPQTKFKIEGLRREF